MFRAPKMPKLPARITGETAESVQGARLGMRRRLQALFGRQSTILTGGQGASLQNEGPTLLGQ